jgi:hypothetical protein
MCALRTPAVLQSVPSLLLSCPMFCRKMVATLAWLEHDWYTTQAAAPVVSHWAHAMAWLMGNPGATFSAEVGGYCGRLGLCTVREDCCCACVAGDA